MGESAAGTAGDKDIDSALVPVARIGRVHGFPKDGAVTLRADLFNPGGALFRGLSRIFVSASPDNYITVDLVAPPAPHGGAFGRASSVLLRFAENLAPATGSLVAVPRNTLPRLDQGLYVCDLLGARVLDESNVQVGIVTSFQDVAPTLGSSVNLEVMGLKGESFAFPAAWIDLEHGLRNGTLRVPSVAEWMV